MNKLLLGTTALVGASFAASAALAAPTVRIGGYMDFQAGMSSQDIDGFGPAPGVAAVNNNERGFGFVTDTELLIRASDKLDNGLAWSVTIELEADTDTTNAGSNNNSDETYLTLSGSWGQLVLGNQDGPVDQMDMTGDGMISGIGVSGAKGFRRWTNTRSFANSMHLAAADIENTSDATKVMYYTPKIAGFQFGASYSANNADNGRSRAQDGAGGVTGGVANWWELGAQYEGKFSDDVSFGLALASSIGDAERTVDNDVFAWRISGMVEFGGFTVSAGYGDDGDSRNLTATQNDDRSSYGGGVKYATGPYQVGVSYMRTKEGTGIAGGGDHTADVFSLSASYALGAGLTVYADTWHYQNDTDNAAQKVNENKAIGALAGIIARF
ncbi:MAG: porin [Alphaproteobacteria bacterium]